MIADLKSYPAYRDSGVPWLGAVPTHWEVRQLGRIGRFSKGRGGTKEDETLQGVPCVRYGDLYTRHQFFIKKAKAHVSVERSADYTPIHYGDVLFAGSGETIEEIGKSAVNLLPEPACCGGDVSIFRPSIAVDAKFLGLATDCPQAAYQKSTMGRGITIMHVYGDELKYLWIVLPPLPEQAAIARFLDHMDQRTQRYIRAKEKLIALREEQKQAIMHRGVTRGLDPNVPLRPSGVEWLGEIPLHWDIKMLKWVTRLQRGYDLPQDRRRPGMVPVVSSGGVIDAHCEARAQGPGVVMGRYGSTDAVFFIEEDFWPHNTALYVTDFNENDPQWCFYLLRTISKADLSAKSAVPGVDRKDLHKIYVPEPPLDEQRRIASSLEQLLASLEASTLRAQQQVDRIREYRTRLIADVVTGKLDVRQAAADLPDGAEEPEDWGKHKAEDESGGGLDEKVGWVGRN